MNQWQHDLDVCTIVACLFCLSPEGWNLVTRKERVLRYLAQTDQTRFYEELSAIEGDEAVKTWINYTPFVKRISPEFVRAYQAVIQSGDEVTEAKVAAAFPDDYRTMKASELYLSPNVRDNRGQENPLT